MDDGLGFGISTGGRPPLNVRPGEKEPSSTSSSEVDVEAKKEGKDVTFELIPGGVITGRVLDPRGQPLAGGRVVALRTIYDAGYSILDEHSEAIADERGNFRLWGLRPGSYTVRAEYRGTGIAPEPNQFTYFPGVANANLARSPRMTAARTRTSAIRWAGAKLPTPFAPRWRAGCASASSVRPTTMPAFPARTAKA
jgi:hypothetical protein